ncbi:putative bifunctional diguanylate cyclase/phosphodiesterase [Oxalobacteraceae bacterium A2-2]
MHDAAVERCLELSRLARQRQGQALADTLAELDTELMRLRSPPGAATIEMDLMGYVTGWSEGAQQLLGYTAEQAVGQHVLFLYPEDDDGGDIGTLQLAPEAPSVSEVWRRTSAGQLIRLRRTLTLRADAGGEAVGMRVLLKQLEPLDGALPAVGAAALHSRLVEQAEVALLITDLRQRIIYVNPAFSRIAGYSAAQALGQSPDLLRSGVPDAELRTRVQGVLQDGVTWRGEIIGKRGNGELFPQSVTVSALRDEAGRISHCWVVFSDLSVHKDAQARIQRLANYDQLTGLPNLGLLHQLLGQVLTEARRARSHGALLVLELTRVGAISDTLGHEVGNALLCEIARQFRAALRDGDILARLDGARFAVALPRIEKREHAAIVAQKLLKVLDTAILVEGHALQAGAHAGITVYPQDGDDVPVLLHYAEMAAGRASHHPAPALAFYSEEMNQRAQEHLRIESELREALANGELMLYYQPKVSLRSGRIVGAEALLRWRHPVRGMVSPGVFIPVAEETGLILELGAWVLDEACRQVRAWNDANLIMPPVAVNLSARQFDQQLPARVAAVLDKHGVQPGQINLEITESLLVRGADSVVAIMNQLVAMGMSLALDDFGTGYSSLAYLKKFPISTLKIDRAFVVGLPYEENDCAIARAIVTMGQQLRQEIVAEGVETAEQMAFLRELGCDQLQGYLFSQPVPAADFAAMLREGKRLAFGGR